MNSALIRYGQSWDGVPRRWIGGSRLNRHGEDGLFYMDCPCSECTPLRNKYEGNQSREMVAADIYEAGGHMYEAPRPREMTAEDLGLPLGQWAVDWLNATYGDCQPPLWMWLTARPVNEITEWFRSKTPDELREIWFSDDAPYSFWLGREAA